MLRLVLTVGLGIVLFLAQGQIKKFYTLDDVRSFDTVNFHLNATSGISFIRHVNGGNPLSIFGNPDLNKINPSFDAHVSGRQCHVNLELEEFRKSGLGDGLAYAVMKNTEEDEDNYWKFLINDSKIYLLDLHYGIGSSDIDLSGTHVSRLKINTGSADVVVSYERHEANLTEMDTFQVKVDVGSLVGKDMAKSRARNVIAEVGFGQAMLDFGQTLENMCSVNASVGAGMLKIILPREAPVIIHIKPSPLCSIDMVRDFEEVEENVYISRGYDINADELLSMRIDVALGSVSFRYKD